MKEKEYKSSLTHKISIVFLLVSFAIFGQDPVEQDSIKPQSGYNLGQLKIPNPASVVSKYIYHLS